MGLPREDLLLMLRALKRGTVDLKGIRKALEKRASKPITLLEALHPRDPEALARDAWTPDPTADRGLLDSLRDLLVEAGEIHASEWERCLAAVSRPTQRVEFAPLAVPMEFDGYTLQWEVARRERGVVYRAKDREGRDVAIKVFRRGIPVAGDPPRIEGMPYVVAPFEEGETLEARGKHGLKWAVQAVAKAAEQLRAKPHGALAPQRILVRRDDAVVVLGREHAKAVASSSRSALYGPGDDVRALGAILYEAITGGTPSGAASPAARERDVDPALDRVVSAALSNGYASIGDLADDLGRHLRGEPVTARKAAAAPRPGTTAAGRPWIWAAAAVVLVAVAATWLATRGSNEPPPAAPPTAEAAPSKPGAPPKAPEPAKPVPLKLAEVPSRPMTSDEEQKLYNECLQAFGSKDVARVITAANEAVLRGTKKDWPYAFLVRAFTERDELDKALEYAARAAEAWPENREFRQLQAETLIFRGQTKPGLGAYARLYPNDAELRKESELLMDQLKGQPGDGRTLLLLGVLFQLRGHPDMASMYFTKAHENGQRRALAWRARAASQIPDAAAAAKAANAYLTEFPSDFATDEMRALLKELQ